MSGIELLAPVGGMKKLHTALHFGADAVYFGGKDFSLRAFADNFSAEEMKEGIALTHANGKKAYVTLNIFASNADFPRLKDYLATVVDAKADAVIVSDAGVLYFIKKYFPSLSVHISTQANTTNRYAAEFWANEGADRIVLARELCLSEIAEISQSLAGKAETEVFIHGAMCMSYSGRCLLSAYLTGRDGNRGECAQACRWEYEIREKSRLGSPLTLVEDERGSYILNSKDLNAMSLLSELIDAGVSSFKIEGRMKSEYYVGSVVNAYRRRLDEILLERGMPNKTNGNDVGDRQKNLQIVPNKARAKIETNRNDSIAEQNFWQNNAVGEGEYGGFGESFWLNELDKVNHREYTTGFYMGKPEQCYRTSKPLNAYAFAAEVLGYDAEKQLLCVEQRNRFRRGTVLEAITSTGWRTVETDEIFDEKGAPVEDCKIVQQKLFIKTKKNLLKYDILRMKTGEASDAE